MVKKLKWNLVLMSVLEPGDNCVVIKPSYQQHYDIPKGSGIVVKKREIPQKRTQ